MSQEIRDKIKSIINEPDTDEQEIISQLKQWLKEYELQNTGDQKFVSIQELVAENLQQLRDGLEPINLIKTGFADFDDLTGGLALGEFIIFGGRPSMGKTQFLISLALNISVETPVLFFSFDLSDFLLTHRFISTLSGIKMNKLMQNQLDDADKAVLTSVEREFADRRLLIASASSNSISGIRAYCQKMIQEKGVKVILVDYLQIMSSPRQRRNSRESEIGHISRELKQIAKDFNVCVIATSQLSRAVESRNSSKIPQLSDLRDSGALEQDADKVIFLYRPEYYDIKYGKEGDSTAGLTHLIVAKNRSGILGEVSLFRDAESTNYSNFYGHEISFNIFESRLEELKAQNSDIDLFIDKLGSGSDEDEPEPPF